MKPARNIKHDIGAFRDGKIHVQAVQCETCIFHPGNPFHLDPGRLKKLLDGALANDTCIDCHDTLRGPRSVCRGFYDRYQTMPLVLARAMGLIVETKP